MVKVCSGFLVAIAAISGGVAYLFSGGDSNSDLSDVPLTKTDCLTDDPCCETFKGF